MELYPPTKAVKLTCADGSIYKASFQTQSPVVSITESDPVPLIPRNIASGPREYYEKTDGMVLNNDKLMLEALGKVPPMKFRTRYNRLEQWRPYTPKEGDVIGFMGGFRMYYLGLAYPVERCRNEGIHVFLLNETKYVPLLRIVEILSKCGNSEANAPMTSKSERALKNRFSRCSSSINIKSSPTEVYDSLIIMKLIGATSLYTPNQTLVSVNEVNRTVAEFGTGDFLTWSTS